MIKTTFKSAVIMTRKLMLAAAAAGCALIAVLPAGPASATSITFAYGSLLNGATDTQIQNYMNSQLGANGSVTVGGAVGSNSYNADGHVTGPVSGSTVTSYTLANLAPAGNGTFIMNNSEGDPASNDISMSFKGLTIASVSFDLEIFPDISCTALSAPDCGGSGNPNQPDLTLLANGTSVEKWLGLTPGSSGNSNGINASSYVHSPNSGADSDELAPQLLGSSGVIDLPVGTTTLDFQDWPATIAINDLTINFDGDTPPVPEPGTLALFGPALFGLLSWRRRPRAV
jgi:hypothetical protein